MACIWMQRGGRWQARAVLSGRLLPGEDVDLPGVAFLAQRQGAALLVRPGVRVRVNGEPVLGDLRLLEHRDEVLIGSVRVYFSQEATPAVVAFHLAEGQRPPICPICRGPVRDGMAVQCPGCGRWFHQRPASDDQPAKPCWTYAPTCRFCSHPTALTSDAAWQPEQEECLV